MQQFGPIIFKVKEYKNNINNPVNKSYNVKFSHHSINNKVPVNNVTTSPQFKFEMKQIPSTSFLTSYLIIRKTYDKLFLLFLVTLTKIL